MQEQPSTLAGYANAIIRASDPEHKLALAHEAAAAWSDQTILAFDPAARIDLPDVPGRPARPELRSPRDMPRRRAGSLKGLIALVHSLVHIELNAIDMTWDTVGRFCQSDMPRCFVDEAVQVGLDEACHFALINNCLRDLGASYGDLPAHGGLWDAAMETRHDLLARLAIVPLVLEARGLDVSPPMTEQIRKAVAKDTNSKASLLMAMELIYKDEITHVAFGARWFKYVCAQKNLEPTATFHALVQKHFSKTLRPPFNTKARTIAGLPPSYYLPLASASPQQRQNKALAGSKLT